MTTPIKPPPPPPPKRPPKLTTMSDVWLAVCNYDPADTNAKAYAWSLANELIDKVADVNTSPENEHGYPGMSVLWLAASNGEWNLVKKLIDKGADVNTLPKDVLYAEYAEYAGMSVLWLAAKNREWDLVKKLIDKGADVNTLPKYDQKHVGVSVLWLAAKNGEWGLVKKLIDKGADVNTLPKYGQSAMESVLWLAAKNGEWDLVNQLIAKGATANSSVLDILAFYGKLEDLKEQILKNSTTQTALRKDINKFINEAKDVQTYLAKAPFLASIYASSKFTYLIPIEQEAPGFIYFTRRVFSQFCDDEHADQYKASGFETSIARRYMVNVCESFAKTHPKAISAIFEKVKTQLSTLADSCNWSNDEKAGKIMDFFNNANNANKPLVIDCTVWGHAMVAKLVKKEGNIFLYIYNDGAGVELNHTLMQNPRNPIKKTYADSIAYEIPSNANTKNSIIALLSTTSDVNVSGFYDRLTETMTQISASRFKENELFSSNQQGATCTVKSTRAFLHSALGEKDYLLLKLSTNVITLNEHYNLVTISKEIAKVDVEQIDGVCKNIIRLVEKIKKYEATLDSETKIYLNNIIEKVKEINSNVLKIFEPQNLNNSNSATPSNSRKKSTRN